MSCFFLNKKHVFICVTQILSAPPWGDSSAQEAEAQEYCPVPGFCQPGWFHQDLHGGSTRRYTMQNLNSWYIYLPKQGWQFITGQFITGLPGGPVLCKSLGPQSWFLGNSKINRWPAFLKFEFPCLHNGLVIGWFHVQALRKSHVQICKWSTYCVTLIGR